MDRRLESLQYQNTSVIEPPKINRTNLRRVTLDINSADRNHTNYPNPSQYTYYCKEAINEIADIELSSINLPNSLYNINETNNKLYFINNVNTVTGYDSTGRAIRDNTTKLLSANMPYGNYKICVSLDTNLVTSDDFSKNLSTTLKNNISNTFTITANINTNKYTILPSVISNAGHTLLVVNTNNTEYTDDNTYQQKKLLPNTIGDIIGMDRNYSPFITGNVSTTASNATITGTNTNFLTDLSHILPNGQISIVNANIGGTPIIETLKVQSINSNIQITLNSTTLPTRTRSYCELAPVKFKSNSQYNLDGNDIVYLHIDEFKKIESKSSGAQDAFYKINLNKGTFERVHNNLKYNTNNIVKNLKRINRLTIYFTDRNGNIVDFNGKNHNFTLEFNCYKQPIDYSY